MKPLENVTVFEKQQIVLECEYNQPNLEAVWQKDNIDIKYSIGLDRCNRKCNGTIYSLVIYESRFEDAGLYTCTLKHAKTSGEVKVLEKPVEVIKPLQDEEVVEKQTATFVCTLSKPRLKVTWLKNGKKINENDHFQFAQEGKVYKLMINNAQLDDADKYTIKFGEEAESTAELFVKGLFKRFIFSE